jgi:hypothetical protein
VIDTCELQDGLDIFSFIGRCVSILWKDWPKNMEAVSLSNGAFSLRGTCPYSSDCGNSVFINLAACHAGLTYDGPTPYVQTAAIMQCQGCKRFILGIVECPQNAQFGHRYVLHYPVGMPDDSFAPEIPQHIGEDFSEAIRCLSVKAYSATAEMCRRALEASCLDLGAHKKKVLNDMIDELEGKRIITPGLMKAAHKIRLGGDRGAHPPEDGPKPATNSEEEEDGPIGKIEKEHAEAIVGFTRQFLQFVYVLPAQLDQYDFSKPKPAKEA